MQANRKRHFKLNDHKIVIIHDFLYSRQKYPLIFLTLALYALIILLWGKYFEVSANYFIIFPLLVISISFGFRGGLIAGFLALPLNLLLFYIIDHMEYAPASLLMAEMSGVVLGSMLGYLSDFFTKMKEEMRRRARSEKALEESLREKEILLQEINHRVKNNLNLIKSFIQLQINRLPEGETQEMLRTMRDRIISIALVQDLLYSQKSLENLDLRIYLQELTDHYSQGFEKDSMNMTLNCGEKPLLLSSRTVTSLGIIINEVITNISKYAVPDEGTPDLTIEMTKKEDSASIIFRDNGPGYPEKQEGPGLGFKLIQSLLKGLNGSLEIKNRKEGGGELKITIPVV